MVNRRGVKAVTDFIFLGSKITVDGDCSHEIKSRLLLGSKAMTNLDSILKSRDITLPANVCLVKAMGFPVVTISCEGWTIKNAEHRRTDAFFFFFFLFIYFFFVSPEGGAPFLEVLQYQVDAWSGRSKLLFQLPAPKIHCGVGEDS